MATTYTFSGSLEISIQASSAASVDFTGTVTAGVSSSVTFDVSGGTAPTLSNWFHGTATCAAGDWLLAHATDPLQAQGDAVFAPGGTAVSAALKLKLLRIKNLDATNTITVNRGTANGLAIFTAATAGVTLQPGGEFLYYDPSGATAGVLTTGTNDKLTISVGAGSPQAEVLAMYGP